MFLLGGEGVGGWGRGRCKGGLAVNGNILHRRIMLRG